jgi:hypothetical protein
VSWNPFSKARKDDRVGAESTLQWAIPLRAALDDLERLIAERPELASPGRTLERVLEATFTRPALAFDAAAKIDACERDLEIEAIQNAWDQGRPASSAVALDFDVGQLAAAAVSIVRALQQDEPSGAERFCQLVKDAPDTIGVWNKLALDADNDTLEWTVREKGQDFKFVASVLRLVLLPELAPWAGWLCAQLPEGKWARGACPVCGTGAALAESRGLEQRRRLRCDRCAADWPWDHFRCPFCGQADHRALLYQCFEGQGDRYRLVLCEGCGGRIKLITTLAPVSPPGLLVAELATIHLDLIDDSTATAL